MVLPGHLTNDNHYISPPRVLMATRLGKMITYLDGLLPIKSLGPLITWSYEITWQTKSIISLIPQYLRPLNLVGYWLSLRGSYRYSHLTIYLSGLAWSRDNLNAFYLYHYNTYGHQTWQGCDIPWRSLTHTVLDPSITWFCKVTWHVKYGHKTYEQLSDIK